MRLLLEVGADADRKIATGTYAGATTLFAASQNGHAAVVRTLVAHGAEVGKAASGGATALFVASQHGHAEVVHILAEGGANVHAQMEGGAGG